MAEDDKGNPITVSQIVDRIRCETRDAGKAHEDFRRGNYVGAVTLTVEVNDKAGLTPSLSFIDPLEVAGTNFTLGVGGELSKARKRTFQQSFSLDVSKVVETKCSPPDSPDSDLAGSLGIVELVKLGMTSTGSDDDGVVPADAKSFEAMSGPVFGTTVAFTIVKSGSLGPSWTLRTFKGPAGQAGLAGLSRNDVHTLLISFAPPKLQKNVPLTSANRDAALSTALDAARSNNIDMRLYSIAPTP
jgi:hypothetical protein